MSSIEHEIESGVGIIRLNRPEVFNSFNREMAIAFQDILDVYEETHAVRAIYITGVGKAFCAGQDLVEATDLKGPKLQTIVRQHYNPIIERLRNIEKPIVSAVNGVAAGAGANIALACDICVATESSSFIQAFSKIGLIPDSGGTFILPRLVGMQKAAALMMLGDKVSAADAEKMGMIYKMVDDANLKTESNVIAKTLAEMPTKGIGYTKLLLNKSMSNNLVDQLTYEGDMQVHAASTYDYTEGVNAFLEKRKPTFKGE